MKKLFIVNIIAFMLVILSFVLNAQTGVTLNGQVRYRHMNNPTSLDPLTLDSTLVQIMLNGVVVMQDITDNYGNFHMNNAPMGIYDIRLVCLKRWGGYNANDLLVLYRNFMHIPPLLTGLSKKAGDVNEDGVINAADWLILTNNAFLPVPNFPFGNWVYDKVSVSLLPYTTTTLILYALCKGDVNGSYFPINSHQVPP